MVPYIINLGLSSGETNRLLQRVKSWAWANTTKQLYGKQSEGLKKIVETFEYLQNPHMHIIWAQQSDDLSFDVENLHAHGLSINTFKVARMSRLVRVYRASKISKLAEHVQSIYKRLTQMTGTQSVSTERAREKDREL